MTWVAVSHKNEKASFKMFWKQRVMLKMYNLCLKTRIIQITKNTMQNSTQNIMQNSTQNTMQNSTQNTMQNSTQNTMQNSTQNTKQNYL